jgi:hypothetical protein
MSNLTTSAIESALIKGDLSQLNPEQRISYYKSYCESIGLNPMTQPLAYIVLNGKLTLYAKKDATDQLRSLKNISITKLEFTTTADTYEVVAHGRNSDGREDTDMGIVDIRGLSGEKLANAKLKAVTKAKRRLTLSLSGLGILDETEVQSIVGEKQAHHAPVAQIRAPIQEVNNEPVVMHQEVVEEVQGNPGDYVVQFGQKHKGRTLSEIGYETVKSYLKWLLQKAAEKGEPLMGTALEFQQMAETYISYMDLIDPQPPTQDQSNETIPF